MSIEKKLVLVFVGYTPVAIAIILAACALGFL